METYYLRAIRIASKSKLPDRWIHSQWYQPLDSEDAGTTFVLIEVVNPWFPSPQITTTITNTFNREYFRARRVGKAADAFEVAVRRVNEALAARAEEGETDWIGNLHAILAVVSGKELHVVVAGKAVALLVRGGQVNPVVTPNELADIPGPSATFGNLVAGTLEAGDKGVLATPDFLEYLPSPEIGTTLTTPVDQAAKLIVKRLQEQRVKTPHAVLFDYQSTPHQDRTGNEPDTIFLDVPMEGGLARMKQVTKKVVVPALTSGAGAASSAARWFWGKTRANVIPTVASGLGKVGSLTKKGGSAIAETTGAMEEKVAAVDQGSLVRKPMGWLATLSNTVLGLASSLRLRSRLLFVGLLIVIVAVLAIRFVTVDRAREAGLARDAAQELLVAAQQRLEEADLAAVSKENDRAISLYVEALDLARQAKENPDLVTAALEVELAAQTSLDGLTNTTRVKETEAYAKFEQAVKFVMVDRTPWTIEANGSVSAAPAGGERTQGKTIDGLSSIIAIVHVADHQRLYIIGSGGVGSVKLADSSVETIPKPEDDWQEAIAVESYGTTLYFLDTAENQIWKYATSADGISTNPPAQYFTSSVDLANALDLAIDGSIYVLFADGTIESYFKGAAEAFSPTGLPKPYETWTKPTLIATDSESEGVFIYENSDKRIVEFGKNGVYKRQFALPETWEVKDIFVSGAAKKLWILAGNDVYEISL